MDGMNDLFGAFSALPYFSAFSMVNKSGTCATSRILQARWTGCNTVRADDKLEREAQTPGPEQHEWKLRAAALAAMKKEQQRSGGEDADWPCLLFRWQICEGAATRTVDWGDLMFCDYTTTRFILIQTSPVAPAGADAAAQHAAMLAHAEAQAHQVYCLLTYFGYNPKWVRCCVFATVKDALPEGLLADGSEGTPSAQQGQGFMQVDASSFKPALTARILDKVDTIISRDESLAESLKEHRTEVGKTARQLRQLVEKVENEEERQARLAAPRIVTVCNNCKKTAEEAGVSQLLRCSRCRIAWYCNRDCQLSHYKAHKIYCRQGGSS